MGSSFFCEMLRAGMPLTQSSFVSALVASAEMASANCLWQVHVSSLKLGFLSDCCVGNALLKGYANFGGVVDLRKLSEGTRVLDDISVEILLRGYAQHGAFSDALKLFKSCIRDRITFSSYAFSSLLSLCASSGLVDCAVQFHASVVKVGLDVDVSVVNSLIMMYSRSCNLEDAEQLFNWCNSRDIVTWNSLISGLAYNSRGDAGIALVQRMLLSGMQMNESSFWSFLSCCASITNLENARRAHVQVLKLRGLVDQGTDNIILTMYCKSKGLKYAENVFESMEGQDNVSFNMMMSLYRSCGYFTESVELFLLAHEEGHWLNEAVLSGVICSCSVLNLLDLGEQAHGSITKAGFGNFPFVANSILEMYSQDGRIDEMEQIFYDIAKPDIFSWNTLFMCYASFGLINKVCEIWQKMEDLGVNPNEFSYSALLAVCSSAATLFIGRQVHASILKMGLLFDVALMNSLITMYSNCHTMKEALAVFKEISLPDNISWNAMVSGYAQNGLAEESVKFYIIMNRSGAKANYSTYASVCMACATLSEFRLGSQFHVQAITSGCESDVPLSNSLVAMYGKCGRIDDSFKIFQGTESKDVITWNSLICAYAHNGLASKAIDVFEEMKLSGMEPNGVTFVGVLSACCNAGLVSEAWYYFNSMHENYGITPLEEHYSCMVDILCRAGKLEEAKDLIDSMPFDQCSLVWRILLNACKVNGNLILGKVAAKRIMQLEPRDSASYILLSDTYGSVGDRENKARVRMLMKDMGVKKTVGFSWISS
ncbi:Pentatricopeptide repeat-containing protein [Ananas comosus]|uniref:Pentatricopeptide repeat-containing protein n=1 Tax=Ananas comosus TaxID=4615 RepID=A0A199V3K8_ANACO|nr:Pentatricopeptide repeat-containing protein [Ananas comosus]